MFSPFIREHHEGRTTEQGSLRAVSNGGAICVRGLFITVFFQIGFF